MKARVGFQRKDSDAPFLEAEMELSVSFDGEFSVETALYAAQEAMPDHGYNAAEWAWVWAEEIRA